MTEPTKEIYAQLADRAYPRTDANRTPLPSGWAEILPPGNGDPSGFSAGVYKNGDEIVISYTGTNEDGMRDVAFADIPAALGTPTPQITKAMQLYMQVKRDNPGADITFTGHSLGGGLASLMDGQDTVAASPTKDNTLSIGGGAHYADLLFQKSGNDLILKSVPLIKLPSPVTTPARPTGASTHFKS
jgi:Lipase (class 3)